MDANAHGCHWLAMGCLAVITAFCGPASGSDSAPYPARPVRLLVPFAPGGGTDAVARIVSVEMQQAMGQPWVVDNRGSAYGNIAAGFVAQAAPDGYTVFHGVSTILTVNPSLFKGAQFNAARDFAPVTLLASTQDMLIVHPGVPANTLKDLVALAKQKPGALNYATAGVGSPPHLAAELFKRHVGIDLVHVPYKGGGPAVAAVLAQETQVLFGSVAASMPLVDAGKLRALATTGPRRSKVAPNVPTVSEAGFPGYEELTWHALLVPARTPQAIIKQLYSATVKVLALPNVQQAMLRLGLEIESSTPQELAARIRRESALWSALIKETGIRVE